MAMHTREEIITALEKNISAFCDFIRPLDREKFEATPGNKWSAGQILDHLVRSIRPLQLAFVLPKFVIKWLFGKPNRATRTYGELVAKYHAKLAAGGRASRPFVPPRISFDKKEGLLSLYENHKISLVKKIRKKNEKDLDQYLLPHPLLGKITLREMLFFTIHHNEHHLAQLQDRNQ